MVTALDIANANSKRLAEELKAAKKQIKELEKQVQKWKKAAEIKDKKAKKALVPECDICGKYFQNSMSSQILDHWR